MNLLPIAEYLEIEGLGTQAKSIFINQLPIDATSGILLRNKLQGTRIDYELPGYYKSGFQLIVRAPSYSIGDELINAASEALTLVNAEMGDMYFKFIRPNTMPVVFPISKGNLLEFSVEFEVVFTK